MSWTLHLCCMLAEALLLLCGTGTSGALLCCCLTSPRACATAAPSADRPGPSSAVAMRPPGGMMQPGPGPSRMSPPQMHMAYGRPMMPPGGYGPRPGMGYPGRMSDPAYRDPAAGAGPGMGPQRMSEPNMMMMQRQGSGQGYMPGAGPGMPQYPSAEPRYMQQRPVYAGGPYNGPGPGPSAQQQYSGDPAARLSGPLQGLRLDSRPTVIYTPGSTYDKGMSSQTLQPALSYASTSSTVSNPPPGAAYGGGLSPTSSPQLRSQTSQGSGPLGLLPPQQQGQLLPQQQGYSQTAGGNQGLAPGQQHQHQQQHPPIRTSMHPSSPFASSTAASSVARMSDSAVPSPHAGGKTTPPFDVSPANTPHSSTSMHTGDLASMDSDSTDPWARPGAMPSSSPRVLLQPHTQALAQAQLSGQLSGSPNNPLPPGMQRLPSNSSTEGGGSGLLPASRQHSAGMPQVSPTAATHRRTASNSKVTPFMSAGLPMDALVDLGLAAPPAAGAPVRAAGAFATAFQTTSLQLDVGVAPAGVCCVLCTVCYVQRQCCVSSAAVLCWAGLAVLITHCGAMHCTSVGWQRDMHWCTLLQPSDYTCPDPPARLLRRCQHGAAHRRLSASAAAGGHT